MPISASWIDYIKTTSFSVCSFLNFFCFAACSRDLPRNVFVISKIRQEGLTYIHDIHANIQDNIIKDDDIENSIGQDTTF